MVAVHVVIALALIQFFVFGALVGRARVKYQVDAPAITGHPVFDPARVFRAGRNAQRQSAVIGAPDRA